MLQWLKLPRSKFQCVELFSGQGNVSAAWRARGKAVCSFDKEWGGKAMDFADSAGFLPGS